MSSGLHSILRESSAEYKPQGGASFSSLADLLKDKLLMTLVIRQGLTYELFELVVESAPYTEEQWAKFLGISTKSIQRYKKDNKTFKPIQTEKIFEVTEVSMLGLDIFGSAQKFFLWLNTPNFALGNLQPIQLMEDSYGKELVMTELIRIDHGIFI